MVDQVLYFASWVRYRLQDRLGQRGAEMVEYAIVIACIAAVGYHFYTREGGRGVPANRGGMNQRLFSIWLNFAKVLQGI